MKVVALVLAGLGLWALLRRGQPDTRRVVISWADGSELEPAEGSQERARLVAVAEAVLG